MPMVIKSSATCETTPTRNRIKATMDVLLEVRKEGCFDLDDGRQLIVKHLTEFVFSGSDNSSYFQYAAFYACIHEIKSVTHLCLIYNLMYKRLGVCPAPVDHQQQVKEIVSVGTMTSRITVLMFLSINIQSQVPHFDCSKELMKTYYCLLLFYYAACSGSSNGSGSSCGSASSSSCHKTRLCASKYCA